MDSTTGIGTNGSDKIHVEERENQKNHEENISNKNLKIGCNGSSSEFPDGTRMVPLDVSFDNGVVELPPLIEKHAGWGKTLAGIAGNVLEWYDFAVFGYFSDVIGRVFFPENQPGHDAIIESFAVFGGAFLMRPIGGMVMGYIGDLYGRKRALVISIFLMAFPTFLMGCLPSYGLVGPFAIIALIIVRLLQGLSVGGQLMSSMVYTLEGHPKKSWGLYGSYVLAAANLGTLLGGLAGFTIRTVLNEQQVLQWGWRIPFLMGILVSISGFYLRSLSDEDEMTNCHHNNPTKSGRDDQQFNNVPIESDTPQLMAEPSQKMNPIRLAFLPGNRRALLAATMVPMLWSGAFYVGFVWMAIYMADLVEPPIEGSFAVNSIALLIGVCVFFPSAGYISDQYGRKKTMTIGGIGLGLYSPILTFIIGNYSSQNGKAWLACVAQILYGIFLTFWGAPMCAWLVESFDPQARLTSVAVGYNLAQAIAGGLSPSVATIFVDKYGPTSPGFLITTLAIIALLGLWVVAPPEQNREEKESFEVVPHDDEEEHHNNMRISSGTGEMT